MAKASSGKAPDEAPEPSVTVTDTGNAQATGDGTAVTGYRGPALGTGHAPPAIVHVSGTGNATANVGGLANTG
ncbi:hypothetical protein GCM10023323_70340 [Streptomyces thinghirensis]|uniref:Uncharacterized protein n=1 Tax=Streptomyces thinghirensis TaxID=551547 RepID=A0ABP9TIB0_9ACTN